MNKFYLVWNPQCDKTPRHRHSSQHQAADEAIRLARIHPGQSFFVLEAVGEAVKKDVHYNRIEHPKPVDCHCDCHIPF